jgi:NAD(P)-dependent dehydrogenase (short-subunit alcohol dehydrogenase family)
MRVKKGIDEIKNLFDLRGKVAIVTGGSGGFGRAVAIGLAVHGADVAVTSRTLSSLEETAKEIRKQGKKALPISCDVTDPKSVEKMVNQTVKEFGKVNILVTSAGIAMRSPAEDFPIEDWQKVMDTNVKGTFLCCQAAGKVMIKQGRGGKVILVGSARGHLGLSNYTAYSPSKGAVHLLAKTLGCEWGPHKINVNAIAPTVFRTPLTQWMFDDNAFYMNFLKRIPIGRLGEPEDFIGTVIFLSSKASDFMTGAILDVDGGYAAG